MKRYLQTILILPAVCLFTSSILAGSALCQKKPPNAAPDEAPVVKEGPATIPISNGMATLGLPKGLAFIDEKSATKILSDNKQPPMPGLAGMIAGDDEKVDWAAILSYGNTGHLVDADADEVLKKPDELLEVIKKNTQESYSSLPAGSPPPPTLIGWYRSPGYDRNMHTLEWAILLQEPGEATETVNFTRVNLGRTGVLSCNVIGSKSDMAFIETKLADLAPRIKFVHGHEYESWQESDGKSDLSLAGLITGGAAAAAVAAKTGLLAKLGSWLFAILLALKKAVILIIAAVGGGIRWLKSKFTRADPPPGSTSASAVSPGEPPTSSDA